MILEPLNILILSFLTGITALWSLKKIPVPLFGFTIMREQCYVILIPLLLCGTLAVSMGIGWIFNEISLIHWKIWGMFHLLMVGSVVVFFRHMFKNIKQYKNLSDAMHRSDHVLNLTFGGFGLLGLMINGAEFILCICYTVVFLLVYKLRSYPGSKMVLLSATFVALHFYSQPYKPDIVLMVMAGMFLALGVFEYKHRLSLNPVINVFFSGLLLGIRGRARVSPGT